MTGSLECPSPLPHPPEKAEKLEMELMMDHAYVRKFSIRSQYGGSRGASGWVNMSKLGG